MPNILGVDYNFQPFDVDTNPGGMGEDGHRRKQSEDKEENFFQIFLDTITAALQQYRTTSATSIAIGTGSKAFTMADDLNFILNTDIHFYSAASAANYMKGTITAWNATTKLLTISVYTSGGSGTHADWGTVMIGARGATGASGGGLADIVNDATPQLGGDLDGQGHEITHITLPDVVDEWTFYLGSVINGTYTWALNIALGQTMTDFFGTCTTGSYTCALKVNGATVATVTPSAGDSTDTTFTDAVLDVGDDVTITITSASSVVDGYLRLKTKRDLVVPA